MNNLVKKLVSLFNRVAQNRTAKELLKMTDSRLTDIGFSRLMLEKGAAGYPWKLEENAVVLNFSTAKKSKPVVVVIQQEGNVAA
jgi:uncharacterized protein YjiS (DUF1127 family)